jgi:hypothetical protein
MLASVLPPTRDELVDELVLAYERLLVLRERGLISQTTYADDLTLAVLPLHQHVIDERAMWGVPIFTHTAQVDVA